MPLSREQLTAAKGDLILFLGAESELPKISEQGKRIVAELAQMGEGSDVLRGLAEEDAELAEIVRSVMRKAAEVAADVGEAPALGHRITRLGHSPMLKVASGEMVVCLRLAGQDITFDMAQDLEDTLWVGMVIVEAVKESMDAMNRSLNAATIKKNFGAQFGDHLGRVEAATSEIKAMHDQFGPDGASR